MIDSNPVQVVIGLDTAIGDPELDPETGESIGPGATIRDLIVAQTVTRLVERVVEDVRKDVSEQIVAVVQTEIVDQVRTMVVEVLAEPFQTTDRWGDKTGKPVTIRQRIAEEVTAQLKPKRDGYSNSNNTVITDVIKEEVHSALNRELRVAVQEAREKVVGEVKNRAATIIADSVRAGLKL